MRHRVPESSRKGYGRRKESRSNQSPFREWSLRGCSGPFDVQFPDMPCMKTFYNDKKQTVHWYEGPLYPVRSILLAPSPTRPRLAVRHAPRYEPPVVCPVCPGFGFDICFSSPSDSYELAIFPLLSSPPANREHCPERLFGSTNNLIRI